MQDIQTLQVGAARVSALNAGDMRLQLSRDLAVPEAVWRPQHAELFEQVSVCPSLSVYIESADAHVLVDANNYRGTMTPDSEYALPGYTPPPDIPAQLASLGAQPEDITHVVITHAHWDHYAGATTPVDGGYAPTYPNARYLLGAADWADGELQAALGDPASLEARTLGVLWEQGRLHLVEGPEPIAVGIKILPAPGETPGHQIVRVHSEGETLYVVGDLLHHAIEVEHPDWMAPWADPASMLATRRWLIRDALDDDALDDDALLIAAHIAGAGRVVRGDDGGLRWRSA